jgi:hypothetical protein
MVDWLIVTLWCSGLFLCGYWAATWSMPAHARTQALERAANHLDRVSVQCRPASGSGLDIPSFRMGVQFAAHELRHPSGVPLKTTEGRDD